MKLFFSLIIVLAFNSRSQAQLVPTKLFYNLQQDKPWIDSMKAAIRQDANYDLALRKAYLKQLNYFNNCITLGLYYEKLHQKKILPSNKEALRYYQLILDADRFPEETKYEKASAIRKNLKRKLAAMYFSGDGVKKDVKESLWLALDGSYDNDFLKNYYSKKYFKTTNPILSSPDVNSSYFPEANFFTFRFNPFFRNRVVLTSSLKEQLLKIANLVESKMSDSVQLQLEIISYARASMGSQSRAHRRKESFEQYFIERCGLSRDLIKSKVEVNGNDDDLLEISIIKF